MINRVQGCIAETLTLISEYNERNTKFNQKENPHNSLSYADLSIYTFR